jgi:polyisoprenoid-binding protein YceI
VARTVAAKEALLPPGFFRVDPVHTFAGLRVTHLVFGLVDGRFNNLEGEFTVTDDAERIFDAIALRVEAASVDTHVAARDDDLRSTRFFDAANFSLITFEGDDCVRTGDSRWAVAGDLAPRDVSRRIALDVIVRGVMIDGRGKTRIGLSGTTKLARSDFELTTELEQESGTAGGFDVEIGVDVEAVLDDQRAQPDRALWALRPRALRAVAVAASTQMRCFTRLRRKHPVQGWTAPVPR